MPQVCDTHGLNMFCVICALDNLLQHHYLPTVCVTCVPPHMMLIFHRFVPGWDTHGLPIELKVLQSLPASERAALDTLGLREKAKQFALHTIEQQKEQFKR
eukprot:GHUV01033275.1.p2 GENE.GHUV01033275.1~~GHUV01033275.1.p2  ORF type:complete len:101 (+),score=24.29 GHUV01033275.1:1145-1447(+)